MKACQLHSGRSIEPSQSEETERLGKSTQPRTEKNSMDKNGLMRLVLGLSIAGTGLAMARPASATVWRNFANENFCLSTANNGSMSPSTKLIIWQCNTDLRKPVADQGWAWTATPWDSSGDYFQLFNTRPNAPPPSSNARCAGTHNAGFSGGTELNLVTCNGAFPLSHDQGWHIWNVGLDSHQHQCSRFLNETGFEDPTDPDHLVLTAFGVDNGAMTNGSPVILEYVLFDRPQLDQIWCAY